MTDRRTGRVTPPVRPLFSLLLLLLPALAGALTPEQELRRLELRQTAAKKEAWADPAWQKLLYYEKGLLGHYYSPSMKKDFFLAGWGSVNPRLEFEAETDGFFFDGPADDSPECRFPERYLRLRALLGLSEQEFPRRRCPAFEEWRSGLDVDSVSLLFAAGYLNNPSTLYGHTFLRLHKRGGQGADLLDYTINKEDFRCVAGSIAALPKPGLGVEIDEERLQHASRTPPRWRNPLWRHADGSVAEW